MQMVDIKDFVKKIFPSASNFYIGKLDNKKEKSIGIYSRDLPAGANLAIGGPAATRQIAASILIHWSKNAAATDSAAQSLYDRLQAVRKLAAGDETIDYIKMDTGAPVDVGTDDDGIYERVVWITIFYHKN